MRRILVACVLSIIVDVCGAQFLAQTYMPITPDAYMAQRNPALAGYSKAMEVTVGARSFEIAMEEDWVANWGSFSTSFDLAKRMGTFVGFSLFAGRARREYVPVRHNVAAALNGGVQISRGHYLTTGADLRFARVRWKPISPVEENPWLESNDLSIGVAYSNLARGGNTIENKLISHHTFGVTVKHINRPKFHGVNGTREYRASELLLIQGSKLFKVDDQNAVEGFFQFSPSEKYIVNYGEVMYVRPLSSDESPGRAAIGGTYLAGSGAGIRAEFEKDLFTFAFVHHGFYGEYNGVEGWISLRF